MLEAISKFSSLETLTLNCRSPMRHIDFKLTTNLQKLSACKKLRHLRLIMKNHNPDILDNIDQYLPQLEILELVGLDLGDSALKSLAKLKNISFLDIASPLLSDNGMSLIGVDSVELLFAFGIRTRVSENTRRDCHCVGVRNNWRTKECFLVK